MVANILVIDAQGGGIGRQLISELVKKNTRAHILAVGTNATATAQMLKARADHGATGENPVIVGSRNADYIIGPIGIVIADSMHGEIQPFFPFLTATANPADMTAMLHEMSTVGVSMAALVTGVWAVMTFIGGKIENREASPEEALQEEAAK